MSEISLSNIARGVDPDCVWPLERSSDLFELRYGKALVDSSRIHGDTPVYGTNGQTGWHNEPNFSGPGIVVGRKGMGNLGVKWVDRDYWVIDTAYSLHPRKEVDLKFAYFLINFVGVNHLKHGTSNPSLTREAFGAQYFPVPPLLEQRAIAEVLGALDDKIAANTALAQHAQHVASSVFDAFTSSWPSVRMSEILDPILGGTPSRARSDFWDPADHLWISARDVTAAPVNVVLDTAEKISSAAVSETKAKPLPAGSVILTARGTVGEVARLAVPASFNQSCYGFRPDVVPPSVLYFSLLRASERAKSVAHGSVFDTITKATFDHLDLAWSPSAAQAAEARLGPLLGIVTASLAENRTLAATRDALLPQLMSGSLRVRDAERIAVDTGL